MKEPAKASLDMSSRSFARILRGRDSFLARTSNPVRSGTPREPNTIIIMTRFIMIMYSHIHVRT